MKKQLFGLMTILTILNACQKNEVSVSLLEEVTIHATIEDKDATKTIMDENNNILWSENDQIIAFMKSSYGYKYQVKPSFVGKSYADFSMVSSGNGSDLSAGNEWDHNVVYYPYSENIECLKSGANYALDVNLPSEQVYVPDSFANGSMAMVAVSENNNITFNNVLGGIKLQLKGTQTVKSIKIEGKNNEKLSGIASVTAYTDGTKPAIVMASDASTSVTLNCGVGVQLKESKATEFIISLPPLLFSKGFTVTVTDNNNKNYIVETDKANTILRSSLLKMPAFQLGEIPGEGSGDDNDDIIPVIKVTLERTSFTLPTGFSYTLTAKIAPFDATNQRIAWSSDNTSIVKVDQTGTITTFFPGTAIITAESGGVMGSCQITVVETTSKEPIEYIVDGVNYGIGIVIGNTIWAPVNCGYEMTKSNYKGYPYGKLYQWGRKYGQGYSSSYDASVPEIVDGPISQTNGHKDIYANTFFVSSSTPYDWITPQNDELWNSGTEEEPIKTQYDPCPEGWRVPTAKELDNLCLTRSKWTTDNGQNGRYFCGEYTYLDSNTPARVFLPANGGRSSYGDVYSRTKVLYYWSSTPSGTSAYQIGIDSSDLPFLGNMRFYARGVRCVQE